MPQTSALKNLRAAGSSKWEWSEGAGVWSGAARLNQWAACSGKRSDTPTGCSIRKIATGEAFCPRPIQPQIMPGLGEETQLLNMAQMAH